MQLLFRTKPKIFKTNPVLFRTMPILFRIFCDIFVLVTFQIWWHFSFGDILVLAIFQYQIIYIAKKFSSHFEPLGRMRHWKKEKVQLICCKIPHVQGQLLDLDFF